MPSWQAPEQQAGTSQRLRCMPMVADPPPPFLLLCPVDSAWRKEAGSPGTLPNASGSSLIPLGSGGSVPTLSSAGSSSTIPELPFGSGILSRTDFKLDTGREGGQQLRLGGLCLLVLLAR